MKIEKKDIKCNQNYNTKFLEDVTISENIHIGGENYLMTVISNNTFDGIVKPKAGQFYMLKLKNQIRILRRPISLHSLNYETGELQFLYRVLGKGTKELSNLSKGEIINIQGPLGKGFDIDTNKKNIVIVGGGIGLAPLNQLIKDILKNNGNFKINFIGGGRDKETMKLLDNFKLDDTRINTIICTDDGSLGEKGNVIEVLKKVIDINENIDIIYSCGPHKVLEYINKLSNENNILSQISMEERMACGQGACVGCSISTDDGMKKVCYDGPVFYSKIFRNVYDNRGDNNG